MDVDKTLSGFGKLRERFRKKPVETSIGCGIILLCFFLLFFLGYGYVTEKGRQLASDNDSHSPTADYVTPKSVTISNGEIKLSGPGLYLVNTEDRADSDELTKISGLSKGDKVILKAADDDRTVVVKESPFLIMAWIFYLNNKNDKIIFTSEGNDVCSEDNRISIGD